MIMVLCQYTICLMILIRCCASSIEHNNNVVHALMVDDYKIIETTYGLIKGKSFSTLFQQKPYYAFKGIPYAEPPIDNLRFKVCISIIILHTTTFRYYFSL